MAIDPNEKMMSASPVASDVPVVVSASVKAAAEKNSHIAPGDAVVREGMNWFVLRVASNKESQVRDTLLRKVQIEHMEHLVGRILVPTEKTKTIKNGNNCI